MFGLGYGEIILIVLLALLLFGSRKLPELAHGLGKSLREFRRGMNEPEDDKDAQPPAPQPPAKPGDNTPPKA
ncbi:MAG TPA: twin-arginine translocase TatA/TatE family subunit [Candidatus Brocadiia bacterium]|nr:twin-arginine translocase TatA/TatE family subunit [Candidatus Brocadiia bacterium]